jgi:Phage tail lysozyme
MYQPRSHTDPRAAFFAPLRAAGVPEHVIAGMDMNIRDESGWNPGINEQNPTVPGSRGGFGLYQTTGDRRIALEAMAKKRGVDPSDPRLQGEFWVHEAFGPENAAYRKMLATRTPQEAAVAIVRDFLRPAKEHRDARAARYMGTEYDPQSVLDMGGQQDFEIAQDIPLSKGQRVRTGLMALSEALAAGGQGHAATFAGTDAFLQSLQERNMLAQQGAEQREMGNQTLAWLRQQGPMGEQLATAVEAGAMTAEDAAKALMEQQGSAAAVDPATGLPYLTEGQFGIVNTLRDDIRTDFAPYRETEQAAKNIYQAASGPGGGTGDFVMAQQFAKLLDPTSVVREGELAGVMAAGGTLPAFLERIQGELNLTGGKLSPVMKAEILRLTQEILNARKTSLTPLVQQYNELARRSGVDPAIIGMPSFEDLVAPAPPAAPEADPSQPGVPQPDVPQPGGLPFPEGGF